MNSDNYNDPSKALLDILQGGTSGIEKQTKKVIINSQKLANEFLRLFIGKLNESDLSKEDIVKLLLNLDQMVEEGKLDQQKVEEMLKDQTNSTN